MKKLFLSFLFFFNANFFAQISEKQVDELLEKTLKEFNVPGISVAIVKDGKVVLSKGYGVTNLKTRQKVDGNTLFGIASNSKAFTTAALAILVDEGQIKWDDKVIKYLPDFKMYNEYVTQEFTIRDLLTHRSGLGLGAGDLMVWPDGQDFTAKDIINNIHFLKPVSSFRTHYDYDNLLYIIAGEVIAKVSNSTWNDFVETRIMKPLQMNKSASTWIRLKDTTNTVAPHVPTEGKLRIIKRYENQILDAAGGIYSSTNEMSKWVLMQLNKGKFGDKLENNLFSETQQIEMWTPQTIIPKVTKPPYNSHFGAYGLGWFLADVKGYKEISHTGGLDGMVTQITLIPELNLGIVVLTNQQSGAAFNAITNTIKNSYLNIPFIDYVTIYNNRNKATKIELDKVTQEVWKTVLENKKNIQFENYVGTFVDNWFGEINLYKENEKLFFKSKRSPRLIGEVFLYKNQNFVVKWNNRSFIADSHLFFDLDKNGNAIHFTMKPISDETDFSYDFQDLDFKRK